jgi:hypothetical protein
MEFLQNNTARQKILDDTTRTPEEAGLIESHNNAVKSVKNNSSLAGADIINYLNKKDSYRKSLIVDDGGTQPTSQPTATQPAIHNATSGTVALAEKQINARFKAKGVMATENGIKVGDTTLGISYSDMLMV